MPNLPLSGDDRLAYDEDGFAGPFPLLAPPVVRRVIRDAQRVSSRAWWYKSLHTWDSACLALGQNRVLVETAKGLLGPDVLLFGCELTCRVPGVGHYWHSDVEAIAGHLVNAWVGLEHVGAGAPFLAIPGSHRYGAMIQDLVEGELRDAEHALAVARRFDPTARLETITVEPGEVVLFRGDLWHGTLNTGTRMRKALLVQYCAPDHEALRPRTYRSPVEWHEELPPCVLVAGRDTARINNVVEPQPLPAGAMWTGVATDANERFHDVRRRALRRAGVRVRRS